MTFLDSFSFAFQSIDWFEIVYKNGKYGEKIKDFENKTTFKGIIQKKKDFSEAFLDDNKMLKFTSMDFELRSPINILPKKGDRIESNGFIYDVIYVYTPVLIDGKNDHNVCIIRLND